MTVQEAKMQIQAIPSKIWEQLSPCDNEAMGIAIKCMEEVEQYRALGTVEELKEAMEKQINRDLALGLAWRYAQVDGSHHKMWVIDQMIRTLCGSEEEYKKWVAKYNDDDYEWDCGIAP